MNRDWFCCGSPGAVSPARRLKAGRRSNHAGELAAAADLSRNTRWHIAEADGEARRLELGYRAKIVCHPLALRAFVEQV
jgi:hypothetical protein